MYVMNTVPKENLLVWNLKDGWEPLCKFFNKPIPSDSLPHMNKTGDKHFIKQLGKNMSQGAQRIEKNNEGYTIGTFIKIGICSFVAWNIFNSSYLKEIRNFTVKTK